MTDQGVVGSTSERLHALDLVRSGALLLGIVFHAALPFLPGYGDWLVMDSRRSEPIAWMTFTLHSFRMVTFFLLAGFFGHMMLHRRGTKGFVWDRTKRILAPLVVFWMPVLIAYGLAMYFAASVGAVPQESTEPPRALTLETLPLTHLWFLWVLTLIYLATLALRGLVVVLDHQSRFRGAIDRALSELVRFPFALPVILAVPVGFLLQRHEAWAEWWGIPTPDSGLVPNAAAFFGFALAFWTGWLVHRLDEGLTPLARQWAFYLPVALVLTVASLILVDAPTFDSQLDKDRELIFASLYGLLMWLWTFGLIGAALRFIRRESRMVHYLADSSYWLYIIHLPILVALEAVVAKWPLPAEIKLVLVVGAGTGFMLLTYHWLVRSTWLGAWINGKRLPRKAQPA